MKEYDTICPYRGHLNCGVMLAETDGWMERIGCRTSVHTGICLAAPSEKRSEEKQTHPSAA